MAKIIILNNTTYFIDESSLTPATTDLQSHLSTVMNGTGAVINLDDTDYNIDSVKLTAAKNNFTSHLTAIAGDDVKVVIGGVEYFVDSTKISGAVSKLATAFSKLASGGEILNITDADAVLANEDNEFGGQTAIIN